MVGIIVKVFYKKRNIATKVMELFTDYEDAKELFDKMYVDCRFKIFACEGSEDPNDLRKEGEEYTNDRFVCRRGDYVEVYEIDEHW